MQAASGDLGPAFLQWTGKFRLTQQQTAPGVGMRGMNNTTGTVKLTAPDERNMRIQLQITAPVETSGDYLWAIAPGACRSGTIPLMPVNSFPLLRIVNGRGELDRTLSLTFPTSGTYHVNIYSNDGSDESGVLSCADLTLERRPDNR